MSGFGMPQIPPEVIAELAKDNQSPLIIGVVSAFTALAFVCVLLRFYARIKLVGVVGLEDYFIVFSMVGCSFEARLTALLTLFRFSQSSLRHV